MPGGPTGPTRPPAKIGRRLSCDSAAPQVYAAVVAIDARSVFGDAPYGGTLSDPDGLFLALVDPRKLVAPENRTPTRLDDPDEPQQRAGGVCGSRQGRDEVVTDLGERRECGVGQQRLGPTGVVEALPGDAGAGSGGWCHAVLTVAAADVPARRG